MPYNAFNLPNVLLLLLFAATTTLGGLAWSIVSKLQLPIPTFLAPLATLLPLLNLVSTALTRQDTRRSGGSSRAKAKSLPLLLLLWTFLLSADILIIALSSSYVTQSSSACPLQTQWDTFWRTKDGNTISSIQNQLQCCGFNSPIDRPFPFPSKTITVHTCQNLLKAAVACFPRWQQEMGKSGGLLFAVGGILFLCKLITLLILAARPVYTQHILKSHFYDNHSSRFIEQDDESAGRGPRNLIEQYRDEDDAGANSGGTMIIASRNQADGDDTENRQQGLEQGDSRTRLLDTNTNRGNDGNVLQQATAGQEVWRE